MSYTTSQMLWYIIVLISAASLGSAAALGNATTLTSESSQDIPRPTCYSGGSSGSCSQFIDEYCNQISEITFKPGDSEHHCYSSLPNRNAKYKCVLGVRNTNANQAASPNAETCQETLRNIASYCTYGGHGKYSSTFPFEFEIDNQSANSGVCRNFVNPP
ncbi:hypothetical protein CVT26_012588 [Gymnopilus dilepis]|uniref:Glycan binding protein Y3-like domain-containing protein n=1 Tax=Gymnopilus dilepis TaxID=231916 RepID=A0A409YPR4_9AGAR|nr:hypothetical protein CVT26_012588 [Gymnopilus dilepis]